ncbi:MAG TPA: alpha/beta hydrolase, partial [Ktedonobacteraceae bacterium]|nr:alpha/beta hydrolase [Ktedonobacteraceae bacterium]
MSFRPFKRDKVTATGEVISARRKGNKARKLLVALFIGLEVLILSYIGISFFVATQMAYAQPKVITETPAALGLNYRDVSFLSRQDHLLLRGWFMPGVLPNGQLTTERTIIMVHGLHDNREALDGGLLKLSGDLIHQGFAILVFDFRGHGQSAPAPLSMGYFEQRDVLGAVDFLQSGPLPYPDLGRPRAIGGWGISMGGATMLLAAAHEPAIRGVVADSAYAAFVPLLERNALMPGPIIPGVLFAMQMLYGINFNAVRPMDVVASIAPRPLFFIEGTSDGLVPPWNMNLLATAAKSAPDSHVQSWLVPGANHIQSFDIMGTVYVQRVAAFFTHVLGPTT